MCNAAVCGLQVCIVALLLAQYCQINGSHSHNALGGEICSSVFGTIGNESSIHHPGSLAKERFFLGLNPEGVDRLSDLYIDSDLLIHVATSGCKHLSRLPWRGIVSSAFPPARDRCPKQPVLTGDTDIFCQVRLSPAPAACTFPAVRRVAAANPLRGLLPQCNVA